MSQNIQATFEYDNTIDEEEDIYLQSNGCLVSSSVLEKKLNFEDLSTEEALDLIQLIAEGQAEDEEEIEEEKTQKAIDNTYSSMELEALQELDANFQDLGLVLPNEDLPAKNESDFEFDVGHCPCLFNDEFLPEFVSEISDELPDLSSVFDFLFDEDHADYHASAFAYCNFCESYGHDIGEHCKS